MIWTTLAWTKARYDVSFTLESRFHLVHAGAIIFRVRSLFDVVVTASDVTRCKPDPEPYAQATNRLALASSRCLVVENAPYGIRAAHLAGCRTVGICTTLSADDLQEADWVVRDHLELANLLKSGPDSHG